MSGGVRKSIFQQTWTCRQCLRSLSTSSRRPADGSTSSIRGLLDSLSDKGTTSPRNKLVTQPQNSPPRTNSAARPPKSAFDSAEKVIQDTMTATARNRSAKLAQIQETSDRQDLERQMTRKWKIGDVYAPHDLSGVEMSKWKQIQQKGRPKRDVFDILRLNPLEHYKNFAIMSEYVTDMGRIKSSAETGLRAVNQRKMAKAIRRAIGLGLMPSVHKHPQIIMARDNERRSRPL